MGCFLVLLALISPRLVLVVLWIFSDLLSRAFSSWIIPLLGFFFLPWTTLAYAAFWDWGPGHHVYGTRASASSWEFLSCIHGRIASIGSPTRRTATTSRSTVTRRCCS